MTRDSVITFVEITDALPLKKKKKVSLLQCLLSMKEICRNDKSQWTEKSGKGHRSIFKDWDLNQSVGSQINGTEGSLAVLLLSKERSCCWDHCKNDVRAQAGIVQTLWVQSSRCYDKELIKIHSHTGISIVQEEEEKKKLSHLLHTSWVMDKWFYWCMTQLFCKEVWCKRFFTFHIISSLNLQ